MENKLRQEPAFPNGMEVNNDYGMSKKFYAACAAMQGILSNSIIIDKLGDDDSLNNNERYNIIIKDSYRFADELLKQENI